MEEAGVAARDKQEPVTLLQRNRQEGLGRLMESTERNTVCLRSTQVLTWEKTT